MRLSSERGAVLVHVAFLLLFVTAFSGLVLDYGAMMVARNQAQNAADAAALAGAVSLAADPPGADRWDTARQVAWQAGANNHVWGAAPAVVLTSPHSADPCASFPERCIRADVFRNGQFSSATFPTLFASLFGVDSQGVRAMAVAQTNPATGSECLKPWIVPDRYSDANGNGRPDAGEYTPPSKNADGTINYGTGYTPADIGVPILLKPGKSNMTISPSDYYEIDDPEFGVNGGAEYRAAIAGCVIRRSVGETVSALPGNRVGPTKGGFDDLLTLHDGGPVTIMVSMFDPYEFEMQKRQSGNFPITITNMLAFRVTSSSMDNNGTITATIIGAPSEMTTACTAGPCPSTSGLVSTIRLVR